MTARLQDAEREPALQQLTSATASDVAAWLEKLRVRRDKKEKLVTNAEQFAAVEKVAQRVMQEVRAEADESKEFGEPLRWCVHGGPGTGKSKHVLAFLKELFEEVLHWDMGIQFQVVALQAVMATLLGGDTIHHACGIPVYNRGDGGDKTSQKQIIMVKTQT